MMNIRILNFFFFIFLIFPLIQSTDVTCPFSYCSYNTIKYPFKLQDQQPKMCSDYINLNCTSEDNAILNLPFSGEFFVEEIDYDNKSISLYDPQHCLAKRLMNLDLSSSPFAAISSQNYTYYNCSETDKLFSAGFTPINCLNNSSNATVVSSNVSSGEKMKSYGCTPIVTVEIPVTWIGQFDRAGDFSDFQLTWNVPSCKDCEEPDYLASDLLPIYIALGTLVGLICFGILTRIIIARNLANRTAASTTREEVAMTLQTTTITVTTPPHSASAGAMTSPDEHYLKTTKISSFLEGNFSSLEAHDQGSSCTICLEEYSPQDTIKCLTLCHHYFHAKCIDQWLQENSSCPVCRTSTLDVKL